MSLDRELLLSPACFQLAPTRATKPGIEHVRLSAASAGALAELLQVLGCGGESAALAFDHLGNSWHDSSLRSALAGIAADEREHQVLLAGLRESLPQPQQDPSLESTSGSPYLLPVALVI